MNLEEELQELKAQVESMRVGCLEIIETSEHNFEQTETAFNKLAKAVSELNMRVNALEVVLRVAGR